MSGINLKDIDNTKANSDTGNFTYFSGDSKVVMPYVMSNGDATKDNSDKSTIINKNLYPVRKADNISWVENRDITTKITTIHTAPTV
jgi:hypothetical protein